MEHLSDKDFFKFIRKESRDYSEDITEGFPYFCLKIFWDSLSHDDIENALEGLKTNDESIDAFFIDEEKREINFLQCKSCQSEKKIRSLKKEWLSYLAGMPTKLADSNFIDSHKNERVMDIATEYSLGIGKGFKARLHFFHMGRAEKNILTHYEGRITYHGWDDIKEEYQDYLSKLDRTEPPEISIRLDFDTIQPKISPKHRTLVSVITGDEIINLREKYRYKLFDKNLRFGLGKNKINKGIVETARNEPKNFYFFNNGITFTSKGFKFQQTSSKLRIEYPQIINGAQTVNAIYEAFNQRCSKLARQHKRDAADIVRKEFRDIRVLFRIIQDQEKDGKKTSTFEEKVTRYNNSQNSIRETDFYANNPEQIELQKLFAHYGYFYEIKRGDRKYLELEKEEHNLLKLKKIDFQFWNEKIDIEKLASIWMAYQGDPTLDKIQKSNIFGYAQDKYYDELFKSKDFDDNIVKEMILANSLFNIIASQVDIYGNTVKKGQIISRVAQIRKDDADVEKKFNKIKEIVQNSLFLGTMFKSDCETMDKFFKNKDGLLEMLKEYQFFAQGRYLMLAVFALIIKECGYLSRIIEHDLFIKQEFIKRNVVGSWIKIILDELFKKEYAIFEKETGSSVKTFYARSSTWENIQKRFKKLKYAVNKEISDVFPLKLL